jgi:hypothetical protein
LNIGQTIRAEYNDSYYTFTVEGCTEITDATTDPVTTAAVDCWLSSGNDWAGSSTMSVAFSTVNILISAFGLMDFPAASEDADVDADADANAVATL